MPGSNDGEDLYLREPERGALASERRAAAKRRGARPKVLPIEHLQLGGTHVAS